MILHSPFKNAIGVTPATFDYVDMLLLFCLLYLFFMIYASLLHRFCNCTL